MARYRFKYYIYVLHRLIHNILRGSLLFFDIMPVLLYLLYCFCSFSLVSTFKVMVFLVLFNTNLTQVVVRLTIFAFNNSSLLVTLAERCLEIH